jgi:mono/diheme cytochrome c family protein
LKNGKSCAIVVTYPQSFSRRSPVKFPKLTAKNITRFIIGLIIFLALIQLVPYGRAHMNPPVLREPAWDSAQTRELFFRVCKNCHSNETVWPWYANVAPLSWLVQSDVSEGRSNLNVSEWGQRQYHGDKAAGEVREGDMPPFYYLPLHPEAWLSKSERADLARGLARTFGDKMQKGNSLQGQVFNVRRSSAPLVTSFHGPSLAHRIRRCGLPHQLAR